MICYDRLGKTMKDRGVTIYQVQKLTGNMNLRVVLNSGRFIDLKTVDKLCKILECGVEDIMEYKEGPQIIKPILRKQFYYLDWNKVLKLVNDRCMTLYECSLDMGKAKSYLSNIGNMKKVTHRVARLICDYFEVDITDIT